MGDVWEGCRGLRLRVWVDVLADGDVDVDVMIILLKSNLLIADYHQRRSK